MKKIIQQQLLSALFVGAAFSASAVDYTATPTKDSAWSDLVFTPEGTPGSADNVTINGGKVVTLDGQNLTLNNLVFKDNNTKLSVLNGATLQLLNPANGGGSTFHYGTSFDIADSTVITGAGTIGDPSTFSYGKMLSFWFANANVTNSTIYGGISSWHGNNQSLNFTNSSIISKGATLFEFQGNGGTTANFDNTTLTLMKNDNGTWANALGLYSHNASVTNKSILNLNNGSKFIAADVTEYGVTSGGSSFMAWVPTNNGYIEANVNSGSSFVGGSFTIGNNAGAANAYYSFNVNGTSAEQISSAWFSDVYINLSGNATATSTDNYLSQIAIGDFADFRATALNVGRSYNDANIAKHGVAQVTVGSNSVVSIMSGTGNTGNLGIGSQNAIEGGTSQVIMDGNSSKLRSWVIYMGNTNSLGGKNILSVESDNLADTTKRNEIWNYGISLQNSTNASSTLENYAYIGGNTYLRGGRVLEGGDNSLNLFVGYGTGTNTSAGTAAGKSVLEFDSTKGLIEFAYLYKIWVGNSESTGGTGELVVRGNNFKNGSQNSFYLSNNLQVYGGVGFDKTTNLVGGKLTMIAGADGFAKISADKIIFTGLLTVDFTGLAGTYESGIAFDLLEYRNGNGDEDQIAWLELCEAIAGGDYTNVNVITRDESDEVYFELNGSTLTVNYVSTVPEPSTYALIFGALSLAFVAYRRKARKD